MEEEKKKKKKKKKTHLEKAGTASLLFPVSVFMWKRRCRNGEMETRMRNRDRKRLAEPFQPPARKVLGLRKELIDVDLNQHQFWSRLCFSPETITMSAGETGRDDDGSYQRGSDLFVSLKKEVEEKCQK